MTWIEGQADPQDSDLARLFLHMASLLAFQKDRGGPNSGFAQIIQPCFVELALEILSLNHPRYVLNSCTCELAVFFANVDSNPRATRYLRCYSRSTRTDKWIEYYLGSC